jgi:hypothetical protein
MNPKILEQAWTAQAAMRASHAILSGDKMPGSDTQRRMLEERFTQQKSVADSLYKAALDELDRVDEPRIRSIFTLRYLMHLTWNDAARQLNDGSTADALKQAASRWLKAQGVNHDRHPLLPLRREEGEAQAHL